MLFILGSSSLSNTNAPEDINETSNKSTASDYELICDDQTGSFIVKRGNKVWNSFPESVEIAEGMKGAEKNKVRAALLIEVVNMKNESFTANSQTGSVFNEGVTVIETLSGVRIKYFFSDYNITVPLDINLNEYGFSASVSVGEIEEKGEFKIVSLSLLPFFNAGYYDQRGFVFVPDGSGSIIRFNNKKLNVPRFSQRIYSYDHTISRFFNTETTEDIRLPVFGTAFEDQYSLGIVTKGTAGAYITADSNTNLNKYSYVYAKFPIRLKDVYRYINDVTADVDIYQKSDLPDRIIEIRYLLEETYEPSYVDMAKRYRKYLIDNNEINSSVSNPKLYVDLYGTTIRKKPFLGIPVDQIEKLTTYSQAEEIVNEINKLSIKNVVYTYINWSRSNVWQKMKPVHKPDNILGSRKEFENLKREIESSNGSLYLNCDPVRIAKGRSPLSFFTDYAKDIRHYTASVYPFKLSTQTEDRNQRGHYLINLKNLSKQFSIWGEAINNIGADGISFSGTEVLYTDFTQKDGWQDITRSSMMSALGNLSGDKIMVTGGNDYTLKYSEHLTGIPGGSSMYTKTDDSVPFYQIALHGSINYNIASINSHENYTDAVLRSVETGAIPRFEFIYEPADKVADSMHKHLFYSHYKNWIANISEIYADTSEFYDSISGVYISNHRKIAKNVYLTEYENGRYSVVNYNSSKVDTEYGLIEAKSFIWG